MRMCGVIVLSWRGLSYTQTCVSGISTAAARHAHALYSIIDGGPRTERTRPARRNQSNLSQVSRSALPRSKAVTPPVGDRELKASGMKANKAHWVCAGDHLCELGPGGH